MNKLFDDCLGNVFRYISDGCMYKAIIFTCWRFNRLMAPRHRGMVDKFSDHISTLYNMYPDKWGYKMKNHVRPNILARYGDKPGVLNRHLTLTDMTWARGMLDYPGTISLDIIDAHHDKRWNWEKIFLRKDLTEAFVRKHYAKFKGTSSSVGFIECDADLVWKICRCGSMDISVILSANVDWHTIVINHRLAWSTIKDNLHLPWKDYLHNRLNADVMKYSLTEEADYIFDTYGTINDMVVAHTSRLRQVLLVGQSLGHVSRNNHITMDLIREFSSVAWDWDQLSSRLPMEDILNNQRLGWDWYIISSRTDITIDMVGRSNRWWIGRISSNLAIPIKDILDTVNTYPWCIDSIVYRTDFKWTMLEDYPELKKRIENM